MGPVSVRAVTLGRISLAAGGPGEGNRVGRKDRGDGPASGRGARGERGDEGLSQDPARRGLTRASSSSPSTDFVIGQAQLAEPQPERPPRDPQEPGGLELVAAGRPEHQRQEEPVELPVDLLVELLAAVLQPLPEEGLDSQTPLVVRRSPRGVVRGPPRDSGRNAGTRTGPVARSSACFSTLCSSRMLPGQG